MLNIASPLANSYSKGNYGVAVSKAAVVLQEQPLDCFMQVATWSDKVSEAAESLQSNLGLADAIAPGRMSVKDGVTAVQSAPTKFVLIGDASKIDAAVTGFTSAQAVSLDLSHSRVKVSVSGEMAAEFLSRGMSIDLDDAAFPAGSSALTALDTVPVMILKPDANNFDIYMPRAFARSLWEWMYETGLQFGLEIK